jgi:2-keto-4-pentenoate hydratase
VPSEQLIQPKAEAEVAFVLAADLVDGPLDIAQCREAVAYACAAIEIVDSRVADWGIKITDTVADNGSSARYVLGPHRLTMSQVNPIDVQMKMYFDDELVSEGNGSLCLSDPLNALSWLAQTARHNGDPLRAGQVILSGALGPMQAVAPGTHVRAVIEPLGEVNAVFSTAANGGGTA